ncbi:MAG TPA: choice-of-anchor Q domain-containing protein [Candidatus Udaeobacter sp.]|nr:choice-of-anchor Q domain-containing protein [Candidatus Udaeobacter sp.]
MSTASWAPIVVVLLGVIAIPARATTISVTNTNDSGPGSLRQALAIANEGDTIDATGISGTITLTGGELLVEKSVTINGAGAEVLAVDGHTTSSVFQIGTGSTLPTVAISGLTIRNGQGGFGGGISNGSGATLTITNSTISGNASAFGGGIFNGGPLTISNTTISGNTASEGGGVYSNSSLTITNSTISGNTGNSGGGGGVFNIGTAAITNSTLSNNSANEGGGIFTIGTVQIGDSVLNAGASGVTIANNGGTVTSRGYNLSSDNGGGFLTGPGDQINTDPMLGPLQNNGGPTFTHELLPGSPAIDAGDPNFTPPPSFDQRGPGFDRVVNGRIDKGSFEVETQTVAIQLQGSGRKVGGIDTSRLTWSGATSNSIDAYRDGVVIATVPNTGIYTDSTGTTGRASFTYKVCEAGTQTCSNEATVRFRR